MVFEKYGKIRQLGHEDNSTLLANPNDNIVIEEKIDGANFRFMFLKGNILFGSRTQSLGDIDAKIGGNWKRCVEFIKERLNGVDLSEFEGMILFGECCVKHSMEYDWDKIPPFLGFDVLNLQNLKYLGYPACKSIFDQLELPFVPIIKICKAGEINELTDEDIPKSVYGESQAEGIVIKNYKEQIFGKFVTVKFKEVNKSAFGESKKRASNDDDRLAAMYCTNARIDKQIFKLVNEGQQLHMKLMEFLPKNVINDIYEEHWKDICWSQWSVNFKNFRKKVAKRCMAVLKVIIVNAELNK